MPKEIKTLINCNCLKLKKFNKLNQYEQCVCRIGTSFRTSKRVVASRVNVTKVDRFFLGDQ